MNGPIKCPWPWCQCVHTECIAGWRDYTSPGGKEFTLPCYGCRPELSRALDAGRTEGLKDLKRPSRTKPAWWTGDMWNEAS